MYKRRPTNWRYLAFTKLPNTGVKCECGMDWFSSVSAHKRFVCLSRDGWSITIADAPHSSNAAFEAHEEHCGCDEMNQAYANNGTNLTSDMYHLFWCNTMSSRSLTCAQKSQISIWKTHLHQSR